MDKIQNHPPTWTRATGALLVVVVIVGLLVTALAFPATAGPVAATGGCAKVTDKDGKAICKDSSSPYTTTITISAPAMSSGTSDVPLVCSDLKDATDGIDVDPSPGVTASAVSSGDPKDLTHGKNGVLYVQYSNPLTTDGTVTAGVRCYDTHPDGTP